MKPRRPTMPKPEYSREAGQEFRRQLAERVAKTAPAPEAVEERQSRRQIVLTAVAGVLLVVLTTVAGFFLIGETTDTTLFRRLAMATGVTAVVYAIVAVLVSHQLARSRFTPRVSEGSLRESITFGALWGGGIAIALSALISLAVGRPTSDARIVSVMFEGNAIYIFATAFLAVVAAPVIEEVLFRGLLLESLRSRGRTSAILASAVLFSLWHVNPSALRYYVLMGFFLGYLYWRYGLAGSITAHLTFNGVLVVAGLLALASPSTVTASSGVAFELPGGWYEVDPSAVGPTVDVAVESPVGSALVIDHTDARTGNVALPRPEQAPPGATNARMVSIGGTQSLRFDTTIEGSDAYVVLIPKGSKGYVITLIPAGSEKALQQFEKILETLTFPAS